MPKTYTESGRVERETKIWKAWGVGRPLYPSELYVVLRVTKREGWRAGHQNAVSQDAWDACRIAMPHS